MNSFSSIFRLCFCLCVAATGATAQYRIDQWTADDGLPQNSVYGITQTRDGYLWMATVDGLARFDGVRFTIFNKSNSPGIVNNRFISLFEDSRGDLWAGTEESGVVHFSGGRFEYLTDPGVPRTVNWIESAANGGTMFHGSNVTIRYRNGGSSPLGAVSDLPLTGNSRSSNIKIVCRFNTERKYSECFVDGQWVSFAYGDGSPQEKFISVAQETNPDGSAHVRFVSAAQDVNGTVWLIMADGRLA